LPQSIILLDLLLNRRHTLFGLALVDLSQPGCRLPRQLVHLLLAFTLVQKRLFVRLIVGFDFLLDGLHPRVAEVFDTFFLASQEIRFSLALRVDPINVFLGPGLHSPPAAPPVRPPAAAPARW
jgi:hypothetical protein